MSAYNKASMLTSRTQGTGKALVLLHGWGMNSGAFSPIVPTLAQDFTVICVDLPGFGENHLTLPSPYTLASVADAVAGVISDNAIVVGWSLGGLVAQQMALAHSEKVARLITIASSPYFPDAAGWRGIPQHLLTMFEQQLEKDYAKTLERFLAIQALGSATARQDVKAIKAQMASYPDPNPIALQQGLKLLSAVDLRPQIRKIHQPTLRIYGRLDSLIPTSVIDSICALQPNADSVVLAHAAHAPFISHPQVVVDLIRNFALT